MLDSIAEDERTIMTKKQIIEQVKSMFSERKHPHGPRRLRLLHRGPKKYMQLPEAQREAWKYVCGAYPKPTISAKYDWTVFIQFTKDGNEDVESEIDYIIAYAHRNIDTLLAKYIKPPNSLLIARGDAHGIDYDAIAEDKTPGVFYKDFAELQECIDAIVTPAKN